ncbi:YicC family protein [bacterium 210917-DFI.7.65]|nr:YicC family protein [Clostridiales bacterium]MCB6899920.1 YicC family protein [bacterium 210917-DFI.7.65]
MIRSMTGYGRAKETIHNRDITIELRSVNNRFLDCTVKIPRVYTFCEDVVRAQVQKAITRGKVDVFITIQSVGAEATTVTVNRDLAAGYVRALHGLAEEYGLRDDISVMGVARFPDVLTVSKAEEDMESLSADICTVLQQAIAGYNAMREAEGARLCEDIVGRLATIEALTGTIEERSPDTVAEYRERLSAKMKEVLQSTTIEESRILMEAAIYSDKVAVDEETVRLHSHVAQLRAMLESGGVIGRKADFLIQELNREANTIGSKCCDIAISESVIALKAEIEKIREQIQNVE